MYDESLVLNNTNLIYHMLQKMKLYHRRDELYDAGLIGLVKAAKSYKSDKNIKFTTYAGTCIRNSILMYLRKETNDKGKANLNTLSLDQTYQIDDKDPISLIDIIPSNYNLEEEIIKMDNNERLYKAIKTLTDKEQDIIINLYKLSGKGLTQSELATKWNHSQSYISRIHHKALHKLYQQLKS